MKILHVIPSLNPRGGGPIEGVLQLQQPLFDLGVEMDIACCDAPASPWLVNAAVTVHALGPAKLNYAYTPRLIPWLRLNASKYDAVIVNGLWQFTSFAVWKALAGTKTPYFVFPHGMLGPWFKYNHPLKHLKKWCYWPWADYRVLRDARATLFTCDEERLLARKSFWLYRVNEVVCQLGTTSPPSDLKASVDQFFVDNPYLKGKRLVLFLGRINPVKGCDLLIEAFQKVATKNSDIHLLMVGPDQVKWMSELKMAASKYKISDRISWFGQLDGLMKWAVIHLSEVLVLPSHHENFGMVVVEALSCGTPVLISNKVNIWREISDDFVGFVDDDTVDGTVRNFENWLALSSDDFSEMSNRATQSFNRRFNIKRAAERLCEVIYSSR